MEELDRRVPWDLSCSVESGTSNGTEALVSRTGMEQQEDGEQVEDKREEEQNERGRRKYGCPHYRRRCRIRAPCCNEVFGCRHCHNEAKGEEADPRERHQIRRESVRRVICLLCDTEQDVQQVCEGCGVCMGSYFCSKCNLFDDDTDKHQYHCDACGICRVGGADNFFHCDRCGCCYSVALQGKHVCVERAMHHNCPVCFEFLFDSVKQITVLQCGHTMHADCFNEMRLHSRYTCPMCSRSVLDLSEYWQTLDKEIAATPMPEALRGKTVWMLCNDCNHKDEVPFHIFALKCPGCGSFNTRQTKRPPSLPPTAAAATSNTANDSHSSNSSSNSND
ncbi:E3 ubiquitin-protein ligase MIEL1-like [Selaginella moellendorffii]|uniref:E3 ubiquitin-protein ligase MIEL1-like n=1 Tax=Selaginella moellendorffii TaxID=88036 RepID=UPI000D1C8D80|nr:E3 ubiquitin-protein ligase MIEL1-like [Selaginella moellendorffii]XP_024525993.1 E3 ubiquitin-protein ligase MIEL1-like [Selaginella moellendorffii]|eukprot:XP_024525992.1 E3 ubiquitin-protein ligase MIEL1-like [Selaginella moellendorffii]